MSATTEKKVIELQAPAGDPLRITWRPVYSKLQFGQFLLAVADNFRRSSLPNVADSVVAMSKLYAVNSQQNILPDTPMSRLSFELFSKGGEVENIAKIRFNENQLGGTI